MNREFGSIDLTKDQLAFTNKILDSDALAAQVITKIKHKQGMSLIRMSDGEGAFINYALNNVLPSFVNRAWLTQFGLLDADLKQIGRDLLVAGKDADYLGCTISGVFDDKYNLHQYFPKRKQFISAFYPTLWKALRRWGNVLHGTPIIVLNREHERIVTELDNAYDFKLNITGYQLNGWEDHKVLEERIAKLPYSIVLVSGGPSGKVWMTGLAKRTGHCVLDIGQSFHCVTSI